MVVFVNGASSPLPDPSSSTTSDTPVPTPPTENIGGKGKKAGLAWPNGNQWLSYWKTGGVNGLYTWTPDCPSNAKSLGFECFPMLWGWNQESHFKSVVKPGYAKTVLGMNEPNERGQANMSPKDAVTLWNRSIRPLKKQGMRLVSPATTCGPAGLKWQQDFFKACGGKCDVDVVALHWYNNNLNDFKTRVTAYHKAFPDMPLWITEMAAHSFNGGRQLSSSEVQQFMKDAMAWMDSQSYIERYFWFGAMPNMPDGVGSQNQLMGSDHKPNKLGAQFLRG
jgi:hypothetical protein